MNKYEFNVSLFGNVTLEVVADSKEDAERLVKDTMESISVKDIRIKEAPIHQSKVSITDSEMNIKMSENKKNRGKERE